MYENISIWQEDFSLPAFPSLQGDLKTDVLIIGGGLAGILTAFFLQNKGVDYMLVEGKRIFSGTSGATTAKITFQHGLIYDKLYKTLGHEQCQMYLNANKRALEEYKRLCKQIDCDFEEKDNYVYSVKDRSVLEREVDSLNRIGYKALFCERLPLPIKTKGGVCFKNQAQFNPVKFVKAIAQPLNIYENTFIKSMVGNTAIYDKGKIQAQKIIVTTHFPFINKHGSYFLKLYQHRSYVAALKGAEDINGMFVDENKKGLSFRTYGDLLLLGGGGHRTGKQGGSYHELVSFASKHYPQSHIVQKWAAQDCMSLDSMPYIGQYSKQTPNLYTACGFNKWGMTSAMVSAMILSDLVCGKHSEFAHLFSPSRNILKSQLLVNGFESASGLITLSPKRCPHLGCALKWNKAEHSWDCSCHGSRFSENGKLLNNPANADLK